MSKRTLFNTNEVRKVANKFSLNIAGISLIVNTDEEAEHVRYLNDTLNSDLKTVLEANKSASVTNAAILCALDYLDRFDKANKNASNMRNQIKDYLSEAANSKMMYDDQLLKNTQLLSEIKGLRAQVNKLATDGAQGSATEDALRKELEDARNDYETIRSQLKEQLDSNNDLTEKIKSLNDSEFAKDNEIRRLTEENQKLTERNDLVEGKAQELVEKYQTMSTDSNTQIKALTEKLAKTMDLNEQLEAQAQELQKRIQVLRSQPAEAPAAQPQAETVQEAEADAQEAPAAAAPEENEDDSYKAMPEQDNETEALLKDADQNFPNPATEIKQRTDSRVFDYEDGIVKENGEVGIDDSFKTFGQMIAEEKHRGEAAKKRRQEENEDDDLPNLSWINDV